MATIKVEDGKQIYFEQYPGSKVSVLLIHGWGTSNRIWDTTLVALQDAGHGVVSYDQRGCGQSDKDFSDVSIAAAAKDAVAVLDEGRIDRVVINGWSLGGAIAVETADLLGERCAGVILTTGATPRAAQSDDFPYGNPEGATAETVQALRADRANFLYELSKSVFAQPPSDAVIAWMWSAFMQASPSADEALLELDTLDQREMLASLDVPVLSIVGGKDPIVSPDIERYAAECATHGRVEEFAECAHAPFIEDGPRYRDAVLDFLNSLA